MRELAKAWIYNDRTLKGQARSVMALLAARVDDEVYVTPETSYGILAHLLNAPRRSIIRTMKHLEGAGYVRIVRRIRSRLAESDKFLPGFTPPPAAEHEKIRVLLCLGRPSDQLDRIERELSTYPQKSHQPRIGGGGDATTPPGDTGTPPVVTSGHQGVVTPGHHPLHCKRDRRSMYKPVLRIADLRKQSSQKGSVALKDSLGNLWRASRPADGGQGIVLQALQGYDPRRVYLDSGLDDYTLIP
jgi:hypothetical protein